MDNSMKVYRRIKVIPDSDSDDESSSSSYHSVVEDSSNSDHPHPIEFENSEISINESSLENSLLSSDFKGQIVQCSPDNSCDGNVSSDETEKDNSKIDNLINFVANTSSQEEVTHLSKEPVSTSKHISLEASSISSKSIYLPKTPGLFPGCNISPIKSPVQKGSTNTKNKNEDYLFQFTSTQIEEGPSFIENSFEKDVQSINNSVSLFDGSKEVLKDPNNGFKSSAMNKSFNLQDFQCRSSRMNVKHKDMVKNNAEEDGHSTNNSITIFDDSKDFIKEDHNNDFNSSQINKSAFNLQDLQASLSKIKVKHKDIVGTSNKLPHTNINKGKDVVNLVTPERIQKTEDPDILKSEIAILEKEIFNAKCTLKTANIALLPDRGIRLQMMVNNKEKDLKKLKEELMKSERSNSHKNVPKVTYKQSLKAQMEAEAHSNAPHGGNGSHNRAVPLDALEHLHISLKSRPQENVFSDEPKGLKTSVELMPHQKHALAWLMWRETQVPTGGILADDMGLGKTLTMISLVLKSREEALKSDRNVESEDQNRSSEENSKLWLSSKNSKVVKGGTLVICPASLLNQWEGEVTARCKSGVLKVSVHHGSKRDTTGYSLSRFDIVVTTYSIVRSECSKKGALFQVNWGRIILDEAHVVRNYKNKTSVAVCELKGKYRWALTGTPIHNKEVDLFALIKFLRCAPFDEFTAWRRWVENKNASGLQRLNTIVNSLMLRRTKEQLQTLGTLQCLPGKEFHQINLKLHKDEFAVYQKVLHFSRTLVAQYLHQKMEKEQELLGIPYQPDTRKNRNLQYNPFLGNSDLAVLNKQINAVQDVKTFQILVLILRLRQICCHPGLIKSMINKESHEADGLEDNDDVEDELESKLKDLSLLDDNIDDDVKAKVLVKNNPVFNICRSSSKMKLLFSTLTETIVDRNDKAIIVSQWTQMLDILHSHLNDMGMNCAILSGSVPVKERMEVVNNFNNPSSETQILLLSLTAGGVGLNLVGANHLFLFDLHWNPQLEAQAYDRIYRVGQKKIVHIYKFLCEETIEQRIQCLQEQKLAIASNVLTGVKQQHSQKLSLNDIKMLFSM